MNKHSERDHALLSASSAYRWKECTPSARLEDTFEEVTSIYAEEGTKAHELAELILKDELPQKLTADEIRIVDDLKPYIDFVKDLMVALENEYNHVHMFLEQRVSFETWVPEGFGTSDIVLIYGDTIQVIDLKFGMGKMVSAVDNPQMRLYALGAYEKYKDIYDFKNVATTIHQPRLDHVSTEDLSIEELLNWAEELKPKALEAFNGTGEFVPGSHCDFCKANATCKARSEENLQIAKFEFAEVDTITNEAVGKILTQSADFISWIKDVEKYALKELLEGREIPGFKLVEGRSVRRIYDADKLVEILSKEGIEEALLFERKLLGITALEKIVGKKKFTELTTDVVVKPDGKPTLVPESDKRPALNQALEDFKNIEKGEI